MYPDTIDELRAILPEYAKDTKLNLGTTLSADGSPDLSDVQRMGIALACAYTTGNRKVIQSMIGGSEGILSDADRTACKLAASLMAMNNVYYRFMHLAGDKEVSSLPAKLRMNGISSPGVPKVDFELYSLAISAINGCGMCMESHTRHLKEQGVTSLGIQSAVRIASVIQAAAQTLMMEDL